jgi:HEAT repeats
MTGYPHFSVYVLALSFASLVLGTPALSASAEQASPGLQASHPSSINLTLSKQAPGTIRLEVKQAPLAQILKQLTDKTGVKIHYSALPSNPITVTCAEASVKIVVECLLGPGSNLAAKMPEKIAKATQALNPDEQVAELWILSAPDTNPHAVGLNPASQNLAQEAPKTLNPEERDKDDFEETLKQAQADSQDLGQRELALYNLGLQGKKDDPDIKEALLTALNDDNPRIREQAAESLAQLGIKAPQHAGSAFKQDISVNHDSEKQEVIDTANLLKQARKSGEGNLLTSLKNLLPPDSQAEQ